MLKRLQKILQRFLRSHQHVYACFLPPVVLEITRVKAVTVMTTTNIMLILRLDIMCSLFPSPFQAINPGKVSSAVETPVFLQSNDIDHLPDVSTRKWNRQGEITRYLDDN
jgi:hypothetical protein